MKIAPSVAWAIAAGMISVVAAVAILIGLKRDPAPLLQLANLVATVGVGIWTAQINGKVDRVVTQTNGANDRLLTMVAQTHPGIPPAAIDPPIDRSDGVTNA